MIGRKFRRCFHGKGYKGTNDEGVAGNVFSKRLRGNEYPDEINGKTRVSVISIEAWQSELIENMIRRPKDKLGSTSYAGWRLSFIEDTVEKSNGVEVFGGGQREGVRLAL